MSDYIKREDALNEMAKAECGLGYDECTDCSCSYIGRIRDIPAADVVEVVRCKDCKYRKKNTFCLHNMRYEDDNGYCSYGERAEA